MRGRGSSRAPARRTGGVVVLLVALLAATSPAGASDRPGAGAGAAGVGDPYYPTYGNGGYDVGHYRLDLRYDPASDRLEGRARIEAQATQDLARFNLDLLGLEVERITIHHGGDRRPATWTRSGSELVVVPERPLREGADFMVAVRYGGVPAAVGAALGASGFFHTDDGAMVVGQPEVAATWFPVNDHPIDKATYAFRITVPDGVGVVANGLPVAQEPAAQGWTTHVWRARDPMASYLATVAIGRWDVRTRSGPHGIPIIDAVDPDLGDVADAALAQQDEMITFLEGVFGRYPFETAGAIVDDEQPLFFSLETQTRPVYSPVTFFLPDAEAIVVHELAHQWAGNDVTIARWSDIWLNEGFATYSEWLWQEHVGGGRLADIARFVHASVAPDDPFWQVVVGDPGVADLFAGAVYLRGGLTLQALRGAIGDRDFFEVLRRWVSQRSGGHGTTDEFIALSERVSGRQLDAVFDRWLFTPGRPPLPSA